MSFSLKLGVSLLFVSPVFAQTVPIVTTQTTFPSNVPAGVGPVCNVSATDSTPAPCPVLIFGGYTFWAYSYSDNHSAFDIVAYDPAGNVVKEIPAPGGRYIWQITVNPGNQTVTFYGQAINQQGTPGTATLTWSQLALPPLAATPVSSSLLLAFMGLLVAAGYALLKRRRLA